MPFIIQITQGATPTFSLPLLESMTTMLTVQNSPPNSTANSIARKSSTWGTSISFGSCPAIKQYCSHFFRKTLYWLFVGPTAPPRLKYKCLSPPCVAQVLQLPFYSMQTRRGIVSSSVFPPCRFFRTFPFLLPSMRGGFLAMPTNQYGASRILVACSRDTLSRTYRIILKGGNT